MSYQEKLLQEGYFVRLRAEDYKEYLKPELPEPYKEKRFVFLFLDEEEPIPNLVYTFKEIDPGADSGIVNITEEADIKVERADLLYQYFHGHKTMARVYMEFPLGTRYATPEVHWDIKVRRERSWWDERKSPFEYPNPKAEVFLIKGVSLGMIALNLTDITLQPQVNFIGKKFRFSIVTDKELIEKLERKVVPFTPIRFGSIG